MKVYSTSYFFHLYPDRSGIENVNSVEMLQESLIRALRALVSKSAPGDASRFTKLLLKLPDLRTLNNMHSEKLLSFRIDAWKALDLPDFPASWLKVVGGGELNGRLCTMSIGAPFMSTPQTADWHWWC